MPAPTPAPPPACRHALLLGSLDGGYSVVAPLWEPSAVTRLRGLQDALVHGISHTAGLNPKAFRNRHNRMPRAMGGGENFTRPLVVGEGGI